LFERFSICGGNEYTTRVAKINRIFGVLSVICALNACLQGIYIFANPLASVYDMHTKILSGGLFHEKIVYHHWDTAVGGWRFQPGSRAKQ
jgi:uncharacterized membrane protein YuzA (DUF378 family)